MAKLKRTSTPGGNPKGNSIVANRPEDSEEPKTPSSNNLKHLENRKIKTLKKYLFGTLSVKSMLKVGKVMQLNQMLEEERIIILAIQETRFADASITDSESYRYFKGKPD